MNSNMTPHGMDRADTGQWRLVIYITRTSLQAWLQPLADKSATRKIAETTWECPDDGPDLLHKIENAVYDHPQLLDDYSADIIIETERTLWVPSSILNDDERSEEVFTRIYNCDPDDMMYDTLKYKGVLWWLVPGLSAFLSRTFPGAKVSCHTSVIVNYLDSLSLPEEDILVLNRRPGYTDIVIMRDHDLITASTQPSENQEESIYRLLNAARAYAIDVRKAHLAVRDESGDEEALSDALDKLRLDASILIEEDQPIPTAPLLTLFNPSTKTAEQIPE